MTSDIWAQHARASGRRAVISPDISEEEFDRVTREQSAYLTPLIRARITGEERQILDYGCGPGRFIPMLRGLGDLCSVIAYDPCREYRQMACEHRGPGIVVSAKPIADYPIFDIVFVWLVLGGVIGLELHKACDEIASCLAPGGLLILGDHTEWQKQPGRWWRFRPAEFYCFLFRQRGVPLEQIGEVPQLENTVTVFAGRKA